MNIQRLFEIVQLICICALSTIDGVTVMFLCGVVVYTCMCTILIITKGETSLHCMSLNKKQIAQILLYVYHQHQKQP